MSVTRINEFRARAGKTDELRDFLASIVPGIASADGCQSCRLLQSDGDLARFVVVEVWDDIAAHQASAQSIPPDALASVASLLDGPPRGEYFHQQA